MWRAHVLYGNVHGAGVRGPGPQEDPTLGRSFVSTRTFKSEIEPGQVSDGGQYGFKLLCTSKLSSACAGPAVALRVSTGTVTPTTRLALARGASGLLVSLAVCDLLVRGPGRIRAILASATAATSLAVSLRRMGFFAVVTRMLRPTKITRFFGGRGCGSPCDDSGNAPSGFPRLRSPP